MNADVKKRWTDALRSGKYEQTTGVLHSRGAFCANGVLLDVLGLPMSYDHLDAILGNELNFQIETLNDNPRTATFAEIADWIDQNVEVQS